MLPEINFNIEFTEAAFKDLSSLDKKVQKVLIQEIEHLKNNFLSFDYSKIEESLNIKKLKSFKNIYRLRIRSCRIIFNVTKTVIVILRVIDRKELERVLKNKK